MSPVRKAEQAWEKKKPAGGKLLVVDNDQGYRASLCAYLKVKDFEVDSAASVEEALRYLDTNNYDLVLLDVRLRDHESSDISGREVAEKARAIGIPCIMITAYPSTDISRIFLNSLSADPLARDVVEKKDGPEAVLQVIRRLQGLTILHLSDIHFQHAARGEPFDQRRAYMEFLEDVRKRPGLLMHPIQAVVVSGDISFCCEPDSFDQAEKFLKDLARDLRVPRRRIILSPGNHDIERSKAAAGGDTLQAIRLGEADWFGKFDAFSDFTARFYGHPAFTPRRLYRPFDLEGRVSIVSFNSCMVEGDAEWRCRRCKREHYPGWIHHAQVEQAGAELTRQGRNGLRIGVFHHHILPEARTMRRNACRGEDLLNYFDPQQRLEHVFSEQGFRILLHGHWHKIGLHRSNVVGSPAPLRFGSGAFWTTGSWAEETANYLLLQLSPLKGGSRVLMRRYTPATRQRDGFWGADATIRPDGVVALPEDIIIPAAVLPEEQ